MTVTNTKKKQLKARRIKAVSAWMSESRKEEIESQLWDIALGFDHDLGNAEARVADAFESLLAEGYTEDEVESVLTHHYCGLFDHAGYKSVKDVWIRNWLPERQEHLRSIQKRKKRVPASSLAIEKEIP